MGDGMMGGQDEKPARGSLAPVWAEIDPIEKVKCNRALQLAPCHYRRRTAVRALDA